MPLIQDSHDYLPYIDSDITPETRAQVTALIASEISPSDTDSLHPLLPDVPSPNYTPLITAELERIAASQPLASIDTSRYEALDPPSPTTALPTIQKASTSSTHLSTRLQNLTLLEQFGKNAWLISNSQLEDILRRIEKELVETREETERVEAERRTIQEGVRGEIEALEESWRKGVGRLVEVQVATEEVKREILERRREGAR